jgi:hypothetical protein
LLLRLLESCGEHYAPMAFYLNLEFFLELAQRPMEMGLIRQGVLTIMTLR